MGSKVAEKEFAALAKRYHIWAHKWSDSFWCPNCQKIVFPNRYSQDDTEKLETIIDYLAFAYDKPFWVECKGKHNTTSWPFDELTPKQESFLRSWESRDIPAILFLSFGPGAIPDRSAWMLPYRAFASFRKTTIEYGKKSFSFDFAKSSMFDYELKWENGGWSIPRNFWLVETIPNVLTLPRLF